jgi:basic amino acid/polyamine antiporter, APA family
MSARVEKSPDDESRRLRSTDLLMFGLGPVIGAGWITAVGIWIGQAGTLGTILAFITGGVLTLLIGFCYAEMAGLSEGSGGEIAYAELAFGPKCGFLAGWLLVLTYATVMAFESISAGWIISILVPRLNVTAGYSLLGEQVTLSNIIAGLAGGALITLFNYFGVRSAGRLQYVTTIGKLGLALLIISVGLLCGDAANIHPLFNSRSASPLGGFFAVLISTPFWLAGFNTVAQVFSERSSSISTRNIAWILIAVICTALTFYCLITLVVALSLPRAVLLGQDLPAAAALAHSFGSFLGRIVLVAGLLGIYSVWNSVFLALSRVFAHMASVGHLPKFLAARDSTSGTPRNAVLCCALLCPIGVFTGRGAIIPVVTACSLYIAVTFFLVAAGVMRLRRIQPTTIRSFAVPGGSVTAACAALTALSMVVISAVQQWLDSATWIPVPYVILFVSALAGVLIYWLGQRSS